MSEKQNEKPGRYLPALRVQFRSAATWAEARAGHLDSPIADQDIMLLTQFLSLDSHVKENETPGIDLHDRRNLNCYGAVIAAHHHVQRLIDMCRAEVREIDQTEAGKNLVDAPFFVPMDELDAELDEIWPEWRGSDSKQESLLTAIGRSSLLG